MKEWFTAGELAKIADERGITSFPRSERSVQRHAKDHGWNEMPVSLCRVRGGREGGGGREYHRSLLPDVMQDIIAGLEIKSVLIAAQERRTEIEQRKIAQLSVTSLRFRQRQAMEARGEILTAIDRYNIMVGGRGRRKAILDFVQAQEEHAERNAALEKVETGEA
ncbi:hypothetical protein IL59_0200725 [Brucella suis bv. 4 str. 40]|nr:hypothetical protein IL59_0200725 [Brucella suis bv. 4 str. 40]